MERSRVRSPPYVVPLDERERRSYYDIRVPAAGESANRARPAPELPS